MQVSIYGGDMNVNIGDKTRPLGEIFLMSGRPSRNVIVVRIQAAEDAAVTFELAADDARILSRPSIKAQPRLSERRSGKAAQFM